MSPSRIIKCVTVGDGAVGNLLKTYGSSTIPPDYVPTVFDNFSANVAVKGGSVAINLGLWETSGQQDDDSINSLRPLSYREAQVFVLAFSLISKPSYEDVSRKWIPELKQYAPGVPVVLVGTKLDLRENPDSEPISTAQGEELKEKIGAAAYTECCSNSHHNVKKVFDAVIKVVLYPQSHKKSKEKGRKACSFLCSALCMK